MALSSTSGGLQGMLQAAVQSVKWSYSIFWQICPQQGILIWGDGYYNGPIKTRKTLQPMEETVEEASLQRSQQLRDLYELLSAGETEQPQRRPSASLSPEDLTETEWFYLMCVSFSFPPGLGLPGKALARQQHVWLTGANEADSKIFTRAILAKSALIQTVVCIPLLDGVVEFGSTDKVVESLSFINHVKAFFVDHHLPHPPKPALSEHSTSNPATTSEHHPRFKSPSIPATYMAPEPLADPDNWVDDDELDEDDDDESDSEEKTGRDDILHASNPNHLGTATAMTTEPSEFEMSEDVRMGSPDDGSANLDSDFPMLSINQSTENVAAIGDHQRRMERTRRWQQAPSGRSLHCDPSQAETKYSLTVSAILQCQPGRWAESPSTSCIRSYASQSAFSKWSAGANDDVLLFPGEGSSQWLLKYVLFSVPLLHSQCRDENSPKSLRDSGDGPAARFRKGAQAEELSANHVLAERRRREKLNERFVILRSLVPFVTKMDKASILGDTIEYLKQLRKKIQDLEARNRQIEATGGDNLQRSSSMKELRSTARAASASGRGRPGHQGSDRRKLRVVEAGPGPGTKPKAVEPPTPLETSVQVSIIESDALLELQCPQKEGLLLDVMEVLRGLWIETTAVQCSSTNGFLVAELRAKVKKKSSIVEVRRAIQQVIPHSD
ncbi:hypothetical protein MLD38_031807 [Melastoma candidum]|uniref:Uncharacterized protein n=1 Tax=Melastoma candidum TaxID=119954 RepID=A0ACB9MSS4_9MYRT|nr:hypothetical protein MLD38_031807 [Melastoma candidum]